MIPSVTLHCPCLERKRNSLSSSPGTPNSHQIGQTVWQMSPGELPVSCGGLGLQRRSSGLQGKDGSSFCTCSQSEAPPAALACRGLRTCPGASVCHPVFLSLFPSFQVGLEKGGGQKEVCHPQEQGCVLQGEPLHPTYRQASKQNTKGFLAQPCAWCPLTGFMIDVSKHGSLRELG